jgi:cytochrome c oxidase subunit II
MQLPLFPDQASTAARPVDAMYFCLVALSLFFVVLIFGSIVFFAARYRRGAKVDRSPLRFSTLRIEITWTVIPLLMTLGIFAWGANLFFWMKSPPAGAHEVNVVGKQWMWKVQHAEGNREINELHVPIGKTVRLTMASQDVVHSFFIPAFRIKQDVVPGRYTTQWFTATKIGEYHLFCAQYCGTNHSRMIGRVVVMDPADYQRWLTSGSQGKTTVAAGARLFLRLGCSGCHGASATIRAPKLEGLFGKPVPLEGGQIVIADEKYIRDSILLPASQIAAGYQNLMPSYQGRVGEEELMQIIAYIKSLAETKPGEVVK